MTFRQSARKPLNAPFTRPSTWLKKLVWCSAIQGTKGAACPNNGLPTLHRLDVLHLGNLTTSALASCSARSTGISFPRTKVRLEKNADWGVTDTAVIFLWTLHQTNIPCSWWCHCQLSSPELRSAIYDRKSAWITCRKLLQTASFSSLQQSRISAAFLYGIAAGFSSLFLRSGFLELTKSSRKICLYFYVGKTRNVWNLWATSFNCEGRFDLRLKYMK